MTLNVRTEFRRRVGEYSRHCRLIGSVPHTILKRGEKKQASEQAITLLKPAPPSLSLTATRIMVRASEECELDEQRRSNKTNNSRCVRPGVNAKVRGALPQTCLLFAVFRYGPFIPFRCDFSLLYLGSALSVCFI